MRKNEVHVFQGMSRDIHPKKQQAQHLWEAMNIRLTAMNGDTLLTLTNERGPQECVADDGTNYVITGKYLGHCVIDNLCIMFSVRNEDCYITKIELIVDESADTAPQERRIGNITMPTVLVASSDLNFREDHPIEAIAVYGSNSVRKVYWTDGVNQPRIINIDKTYYDINEHTFDFTPTLMLNENVTIKRRPVGGMFPAGVIQYAFTYYNQYLQETNIFHTSRLYYTSFEERGGSPEDKVSNSFEITIDNVDPHFDYVRIYSIMRTTLDAVPTVTRVKDIQITTQEIGEKKFADPINFIDTGTMGEIVDPSFLLYVGGEAVTASTMASKNNTLFLGDLTMLREEPFDNDLRMSQQDKEEIKSNVMIHQMACNEYNQQIEKQVWFNTLKEGYCAGFKYKEYYKLGIQFQHETGKWSKPIYLCTKQQLRQPSIFQYYNDSRMDIRIPVFEWNLTNDIWRTAGQNKYVKVRPVVVFPNLYERYVIAQGILNATVYNDADRNSALPYAQSSWFFRPLNVTLNQYANQLSTWTKVDVEYRHGMPLGKLPYRFAEIQGAEAVDFEHPDQEQRIQFKVDLNLVTFHSPDVEFDDSFYNFDYSPKYQVSCVGFVQWYKCYSDIDIQTETSKLESKGGGFIKGRHSNDSHILCSGLFYSDYLVKFDGGENDKYESNDEQKQPVLFMVSPWNRIGSLNNDVTRPSDKGIRSAVLKSKKLSNLRIGDTYYVGINGFSDYNNGIDWRAVEERGYDEAKELSIDGQSSSGQSQQTVDMTMNFFNIDYVGVCKVKGDKGYYGNVDTLLTPAADYGVHFSNGKKTIISMSDYLRASFSDKVEFLHSTINMPKEENGDYINNYLGTDINLYKTQDGVRMKYKSTPHLVIDLNDKYLIEKYGNGGQKGIQLLADILNPNAPFIDEGYNGQDIWYPAGEAVDLRKPNASSVDTIVWEWGDTWYQRYDCMKTYAFTLEDQNSVIEIGSFLVETRVNIDGRYDKNIGQMSNLVAMPTNFNLINPVYSQHDNFFSYSVLDDNFYKNTKYNNQITWTLGHQATADVDEWTRITLANVYDMDGTKGPITRLYSFNDQLVCFQQDAVSQILYDERVAIPSSDGVPIEIGNSSIVQGTRYFSDAIGCSNKYTVCSSPTALYFLDSMQNNLYTVTSEGVQPLSQQKGFGWYFSSNEHSQHWKCFYDKKYNDLYILGESDCIVYSEILGAFTSFMSYNNSATMFNIGREFYAVRQNANGDQQIWRMFNGGYNNFFGEYQPFYITFISNDEPLNVKQFTNIQINADLYQNNVILNNRLFDYINVNNEYQSARQSIDFKLCKPSFSKKKFRLWNIDIPRNGRDRITNTWCKIELGMNPHGENSTLENIKFVMHDLNVTYYI